MIRGTEFSKKKPTVFTDVHGQHQVMLPSGEILKVYKTVVVDEIDQPSHVEVTMRCNIVGSEADARNGYGVNSCGLQFEIKGSDLIASINGRGI